MGNRGLTFLVSARLPIAVFGLALPRPASGGTGCHGSFSLEGYRVNVPDLGLVFGVWLHEGSTGRSHPPKQTTDTQIVGGVGMEQSYDGDEE